MEMKVVFWLKDCTQGTYDTDYGELEEGDGSDSLAVTVYV